MGQSLLAHGVAVEPGESSDLTAHAHTFLMHGSGGNWWLPLSYRFFLD